MTDPTQLSISEASKLLLRREISSVELTKATLRRIRATDETLHSFISVTEEVALEQAQRADVRLTRGESGPVLGIPVGIKDVILTKGVR
ncbi:MAG TPA: amidase family protein, partial [Candidatus Acidoferrales bacterium]|nr:amidase family protein [Candidatus Acidoferrales bacterium]